MRMRLFIACLKAGRLKLNCDKKKRLIFTKPNTYTCVAYIHVDLVSVDLYVARLQNIFTWHNIKM